MMDRGLSDQQIKALVLRVLRNRGCWGARYTSLVTLVRWLSRRVGRDGRRVRRAMKELTQEGYLLLHKRGTTVSLNPARSREIEEFIKRMD